VVTTDSTFNGTVTSTNLTLQSGNFSGSGSLAGTTAWTGGSITGPLTIPFGATLNLTGGLSKTITGVTLTNAGTMNVTGTGNLFMGGAGLANSGTLDFKSDASLLQSTPSTLTNSGMLQKSGGAGISAIGTASLTFTNSGTIHVQSGTVRVGSGFQPNDGTINVEAGTTFAKTGGSLTNTGFIRGKGTVDVTGNTLFNNGTVAPGASPGTLTVAGNYTQGSNGVFAVELGGTTQGSTYDLLQVTGTATLDGKLNVSLFGGFTGAVGNVFDVATYNNVIGNFATFNYPPGYVFQPIVNPTFYRLDLISIGPSFSNTPDAFNAIQSEEDRRRRILPDNFLDDEQVPRGAQQCS
jgi:hypothetical protein